MAWQTWNSVVKRRYRDNLRKLRLETMKKLQVTDITETKDRGPPTIRGHVWNELVDFWAKPEWNAISVATKKSRASMPEAQLHTGGSIPFAEHKRKMEVEHRQPVSFSEVYDATHFSKKKKDYVSPRAREISAKYKNEMIAKYGDDLTQHPSICKDTWLNVTGPPKKGRVPGLGCTLDYGFESSSEHIGSSASHFGAANDANAINVEGIVDNRVANVIDQVKEVDDRVARVDDRVASVDGRVASIEQMMQQMMQQMSSFMNLHQSGSSGASHHGHHP